MILGQAFAVLEFCGNGDLHTFLKERRSSFRNLFIDSSNQALTTGNKEKNVIHTNFYEFSLSKYFFRLIVNDFQLQCKSSLLLQ